MKYNTSLGNKLNGSVMASEPSGDGGDRVFYPSVHLSGPEELDLPETGTITFKYKVRRESNTKEANGKDRYECDLDLTTLISAKPEKDERPSKRDTSTEENLDRLMKEKEKESADKE